MQWNQKVGIGEGRGKTSVCLYSFLLYLCEVVDTPAPLGSPRATLSTASGIPSQMVRGTRQPPTQAVLTLSAARSSVQECISLPLMADRLVWSLFMLITSLCITHRPWPWFVPDFWTGFWVLFNIMVVLYAFLAVFLQFYASSCISSRFVYIFDHVSWAQI